MAGTQGVLISTCLLWQALADIGAFIRVTSTPAAEAKGSASLTKARRHSVLAIQPWRTKQEAVLENMDHIKK